MAEKSTMELNNVLCFLFCKLHVEKLMRASIMDFLSSDDTHVAKDLLLSIVSTCSELNATSKIRERRDEGRFQCT